MAARDDIDAPAFEALLIERRDTLRRLVELSAGSRAPVELDQTRLGRLSRMDALQDQAMSLETARRREIELRRIDAALGRIGAGDFGFCLTCDEPIGEARLALDPATPQCIDCARGAGSGR